MDTVTVEMGEEPLLGSFRHVFSIKSQKFEITETLELLWRFWSAHTMEKVENRNTNGKIEILKIWCGTQPDSITLHYNRRNFYYQPYIDLYLNIILHAL